MQSAWQLLAVIQEFAGPRVESAQQPEVIQHIQSPVIDESRRVVRSRQRLAPLDAGVVGLARLEGNITIAARANRIDRPGFIHDEARSDVQQTPIRVWRGDGNAGHALEPPKQLALRIVGADFAAAGGYDLAA